ncbi:calponin homology domain-containing protein DDB_G0272472 isoform X2 [Anoplopoma fimbria]|uniref:calponin homology domain-containing protein DDB_G0272472 isoform X2 n=1 Tax=Anoplopoma fimbria TaxID=229290 RepID=UPI0023EBAA4B|nr:calponin homology domain-containing protein DDB_G0272472 isoform X2 [Anoplopoma fimbria]
MCEPTGFNIEDLISVTPLKEGGDMLEPRVEQLMGKLRKLQQGKRSLEEEMKEIKSVRDFMQKELTSLQTETYKLEGIHKEKEELCRKLQFQCEESEQDAVRQLKQNKKSEELLEQYRCEIQEFKLKHRKQRMKFENQLHQLIEQHKNLHSVFAPERLPDEIESAENTKSQLLAAEQMKLAQLYCLNEELEKMEKQRQPAKTAAETQE